MARPTLAAPSVANDEPAGTIRRAMGWRVTLAASQRIDAVKLHVTVQCGSTYGVVSVVCR